MPDISLPVYTSADLLHNTNLVAAGSLDLSERFVQVWADPIVVPFGQEAGSIVEHTLLAPDGYMAIYGGYSILGYWTHLAQEKWIVVDTAILSTQSVAGDASPGFTVRVLMTGTPFVPGPGDPVSWDLILTLVCLKA
jgi:hypothetical protein